GGERLRGRRLRPLRTRHLGGGLLDGADRLERRPGQRRPGRVRPGDPVLTARHRAGIGLPALAAVTAAALLAARAADTAPAAKTHPWRVFGTATVDESRPLLGTLWAATRAWVVAPHGTTATLVSARVSAGALRGFVAVPFPGGDPGYVHF